MNLGTCIHFNGLSMVGDGYKPGCCEAGVHYYETFDGKRAGIMLRMPCVEFRELPAHGRGTHQVRRGDRQKGDRPEGRDGNRMRSTDRTDTGAGRGIQARTTRPGKER